MKSEFEIQKDFIEVLNKANLVNSIATSGNIEFFKQTLIKTYPDNMTKECVGEDVANITDNKITKTAVEMSLLCFQDDLNLVSYTYIDSPETYTLVHKYRDQSEFDYMNDQVITHPEYGIGWRVVSELGKEFVSKVLRISRIDFPVEIYDCFVDDHNEPSKLVVYSRRWNTMNYLEMSPYILDIRNSLKFLSINSKK